MTYQTTFAEDCEAAGFPIEDSVLNSGINYIQLGQAWQQHVPEITPALIYSDFEGGDGCNAQTEAMYDILYDRYGHELADPLFSSSEGSAIYCCIYAVGLMTAEQVRQHAPYEAEAILSQPPL